MGKLVKINKIIIIIMIIQKTSISKLENRIAERWSILSGLSVSLRTSLVWREQEPGGVDSTVTHQIRTKSKNGLILRDRGRPRPPSSQPSDAPRPNHVDLAIVMKDRKVAFQIRFKAAPTN